nr:hypothetical protein CFP56_28748 [Quercus suber]
MLSMIPTLAGMALIGFGVVTANEERQMTKLCTESGCDSNCPVTLDETGTAKASPLAMKDSSPECQLIVKSPADTTFAGCGTPIASYPRAACSVLDIKETFMLQFCCGNGDCASAAASRRRRSGSSSGGLYLKYANGTIIPPMQEGPILSEPVNERRAHDRSVLNPRNGQCTSNSWVADAGMDDYTRPADSSQVVHQSIRPGESIMITQERSASYTQTLESSLGFEDIVDIGLSFSSSVTMETSDSTSYTFKAPKDQTGNVVFTAFLRCSTGTGTCTDGELHGEICIGYKNNDGKIAGVYSIVVTN